MLRATVASASAWMQACSSAFVPLRVRSAGPGFRARLDQVELTPGVTLTAVRSGASQVARTPQVIAASPRDDILLSLHRKGSGIVAQHGRAARLTPGGAALYDASAPYTLSFPADMAEVVLQLPRDTVAVSGRAFADLTARVLPVSAPLRALTALAGAVLPDAADRNRIADEALAQSFSTLLRAALAVDVAEAPLEADLLTLALRTRIAERAADPDLTPEALADEFHISLRQLQKLFAQDGGESPAAAIRSRRLALAQAMLGEGSPVASAAYRSGFRDVDTFTRAFKRELDFLPSQTALR